MQYGLLGGKLGHSLSPKIHELFFKYTGVIGSYELLEVSVRKPVFYNAYGYASFKHPVCNIHTLII